MAPSSEAQIKNKRRELVACGVDPFLLLAQALQRNEELQEQCAMLQRIVNQGCADQPAALGAAAIARSACGRSPRLLPVLN